MKKNEAKKLEEYALMLTEGVNDTEKLEVKAGKQEFTKEKLELIASNFLSNVDFKLGGRLGSPKFPMPNNYKFLLNYHFLTGNEKALEAVNVTLKNMALGGIYDQLGGGFARYSVDKEWKVPHFEKMLYDNSQLVSLYSKAYQLTKDPLYKKTVEETLEFIKREMTSSEGGFYSSLDADSEGEEGKFYVWQKSEIDSLIGDPLKSEAFCDYFEVRKNGNWEKTNILYRRASHENIARKHQLTEEALSTLISECKEILFTARSKRIRPGLDDKILTSWNALMLKAYLDAYQALGNQDYFESALKNARFLEQNMIQEDYRLNRNYKDGKSGINGFLDDYALSIQALIALYEVSFDESWLDKASGLADYAIAHFFDEESELFYYTSDIDPPLIARKKELTDNVIPGSNSSMARGLFYLGELLYKKKYLDLAKKALNNMAGSLESSQQPNFYSNWCQLYTHLAYPPYELVIIGENFEAMRKEMATYYLPNAVFLGGKEEGNLQLLENRLVEGETTIYVCQNKVCKLPVNTVEAALKLVE